MFTGFNIKYPEYEVITPQTGYSFNVSTLDVQGEERLKGSFLTPIKINEHLNKCIFESITKKPDHIKTYDDFLKNVTLKDRDALLYGLYHITYEEIRNYDITCSACQKDYPVTVQASSTFDMKSYPDGDKILKKEEQVELPISKGVFATIKQPTLFDEAMSLKSLGVAVGSNNDLITETLIISKFQQNPEEGDSVIYNDRNDILHAYKTLPSMDKRAIFNKYADTFGQYGISLKMKSNCIHCGHEEEIDIDLVANFFRMVFSVWQHK